MRSPASVAALGLGVVLAKRRKWVVNQPTELNPRPTSGRCGCVICGAAIIVGAISARCEALFFRRLEDGRVVEELTICNRFAPWR